MHQGAYRVSPSKRRTIEMEVTKMLEKGVIAPYSSSWSSPVVLVKRKNGSVQFCVDYRRLNRIARKDIYPLLRIDNTLNMLQGAEYLSSLDLKAGYWQIPTKGDKEKTAFITPDGLCQFTVIPFGLCNAQ